MLYKEPALNGESGFFTVRTSLEERGSNMYSF